MALRIPAGAGPHPVAIVLHGRGTSKDEPHVLVLADALARAGYLVVRPDLRNNRGDFMKLVRPEVPSTGVSSNESSGGLAQFNLDTQIKDVAEIIGALQRLLPQQADLSRLVLAGYSVGGWTGRRAAALIARGDAAYPAFRHAAPAGVVDLSGVVDLEGTCWEAAPGHAG